MYYTNTHQFSTLWSEVEVRYAGISTRSGQAALKNADFAQVVVDRENTTRLTPSPTGGWSRDLVALLRITTGTQDNSLSS